jgi:hypothetical protein
MLNYIGPTIGGAGGQKGLSRSKYTIAEMLFPNKMPEKDDIKTFTQAKILKSIHFPGFEGLNCDVSLSSGQEQKLLDSAKSTSPHDETDMLKNRMLLEMAFKKNEAPKQEYDYNEAEKPLF